MFSTWVAIRKIFSASEAGHVGNHEFGKESIFLIPSNVDHLLLILLIANITAPFPLSHFRRWDRLRGDEDAFTLQVNHMFTLMIGQLIFTIVERASESIFIIKLGREVPIFVVVRTYITLITLHLELLVFSVR